MNRLIATITLGFLLQLGLTASAVVAPPPAAVPPAAVAVHDEALRPYDHPDGRPLPLVAHWHRRSLPLSFQIEMIRDGHPVLPWLDYHRKRSPEQIATNNASAFKTLAEWKLPFAMLTGGQWEGDFYLSDEYKPLPVEETGCVLSTKDKKVRAVSPFSPVEPWRVLGRKWTDNAACKAVQKLYPNPPLVLFVSNNEAHDLRWHAVDSSRRYLETYGEGRSDDFKRKVVGDGWIERYRAMIGGMREGLATDAWRTNSLFVAYNALGPDHWGRPDLEPSWKKWSLVTEDRISPNWHMWEGAIPESYDNHWEPGKKAYNCWSMQVEVMNLVFMKEAALKANPRFWLELIFWDGNLPDKDNDKYKQYDADGFSYTPELYSGWVQHNMWTLLPRVAREWRGSVDDKERWWEHFEKIIEAVDRVHRDPVLTRFWRKGELVANPTARHPFQADIPDKWSEVRRWYHLPTSLDPEQPWDLSTRVPVFTLARVMGEMGPLREWLVYAHAPMGAQKDVIITIPEYGSLKVDVPVDGAFYHVMQANPFPTRVGI